MMAYALPLSAHDVGVRERYSTRTHAPGIQAEGKDFVGRRHKSDSDWRRLKSDDADKERLDSWVIYGRPFCAMAAGVVVGGWRNAPENIPGSSHPELAAGNFAGGGNHLWILQDDGVYALYAHATPGSIPSNLCPHDAVLFTGKARKGGPNPDIDPKVVVPNGPRVAAGQFLGRIGNSGSSSEPHLHVHLEKGGKPVLMNFNRGMTTPFTGGVGKFNGPWTKLSGKPLPKGDVLVWAPRPVGNYTFNGTPAAEYQSLFDHMSDSGMMPDTITCKNNGATYDTNWVPSSGNWVSFAGMSADEAASKHAALTAEGFKRTSSFTCGSVTVAVWRK
jgi:hypothetical protein